MRLFVAIPAEGALLRALTDMQDAMRRQRLRGSFTPPENLHLTLAFIGEYPDPERVLEALPAFSAFPLELQGIGAFGDLWWAGLKPCAELEDYARRLRRALADAGIPFDRKRFSPHITLARRVQGHPAIQVPAAAMTARRACLMRSDRGRNGMIYTDLGGVDAR